jgi:hypothetical protein
LARKSLAGHHLNKNNLVGHYITELVFSLLATKKYLIVFFFHLGHLKAYAGHFKSPGGQEMVCGTRIGHP